MNFGGFGGFPATSSTGYTKATPGISSFSKGAPFGKGAAGKSFGKGFGKGFGKPFGKMGGLSKPFTKGLSKGFPATLSTGYNTLIPSTTVVTGPSKGGFGKI